MPGRRRYDQINLGHLGEIEGKIGLLKPAVVAAEISLTPFRPHHDALGDLQAQLDRTLKVLNGRDPDAPKPMITSPSR